MKTNYKRRTGLLKLKYYFAANIYGISNSEYQRSNLQSFNRLEETMCLEIDGAFLIVYFEYPLTNKLQVNCN